MEVGEVKQIGDAQLLCLEKQDNAYFCVDISQTINTEFSDTSNRYEGSILDNEMKKWYNTHLQIQPIARTIDLTALDGTGAGICINRKVAPLTFDEYRAYSLIIRPHIKEPFWLATPWSVDTDSSGRVCIVYSDGKPTYYYYGYSCCLAPALLIPKDNIDNPLAPYATSELIGELLRRCPNESLPFTIQ